MHDDGVLVEERIRRELDERVRPAVHAERLPFPSRPGTCPANRSRSTRRCGGVRAVRDRCCLGPRRGAPRGSGSPPTFHRLGRAVRGDDRPRVPSADAGFQCEGLVYTRRAPPAGRPSQPHGRAPPRAESWRPPRAVRRGGGEPRFPIGSCRPRSARSTPRGRRRSTGWCGPTWWSGDDEVIALLLDLDVLDGVMRARLGDEPRRRRLLRILSEALDALDLLDVAGTAAAAGPCSRPPGAPAGDASAHRSSPSATPTSTRRGCGRCARPSASASAPSRPPSG